MLIFLTGFMCSGKTTDGKIAAEKLQIPFLDLDEELEKRSGQSIWSFIETEGISAFRQMESEILLQSRQFLQSKLIESFHHTQRPEAIIATGGGSVLIAENRNFLLQPDHATVWLDLPFSTLLERIKTNNRPLLNGLSDADIYQIYTERLPFYQAVSTHRISNLPVPEQIISLFCLSG
jgi:shikimate kinase